MSGASTTLAGIFNWLMPEQASNYAKPIDNAFFFVLWVSLFFTLLIAGLVLFFAIRRWDGGRKGAEHGHGGRGKLGKGPTHNTAMEMTWTIIPLLIVIAIFILGFRPFLNFTTPPDHPYPITAKAVMWSWTFEYPETGKTSSKLHVPLNRPVQITLIAPGKTNVIHSFYVPAFRTKRDVVPGRYNKVWFEATKEGEYDLFCAEYCGQGHSQMHTKAIVMPQGEFDKWVKETENGPPALAGEKIFQANCTACHTVDGTTLVGPSLRNRFGKMERMASGETIKIDAEYVRESLINPQAKIVDGFQGKFMSPFGDVLSDSDIQNVIEYLKAISDKHEGPTLEEIRQQAAEKSKQGGKGADKTGEGDQGEAGADSSSGASAE